MMQLKMSDGPRVKRVKNVQVSIRGVSRGIKYESVRVEHGRVRWSRLAWWGLLSAARHMR